MINLRSIDHCRLLFLLVKLDFMDILDYTIHSNQKDRSLTPPEVSVVVGFYNHSRFFDLQMASLEMQSFKNFEVLICDDGSRPEVVDHIRAYMKATSLRMQHLWHKDDGWRKVEMLNKAIINARSPYIITVDQDCILHPEFVREHFTNREAGAALSGRRAELTLWLSNLLNVAKIKNGFLQKNYWWMFFFMIFQKNNQWARGLYFQSAFLRKWINRKSRGIVGCNVSFFKSDLESLNGFDMSFKESCGAEDSDLDIRLRNRGVRIKSVCNVAVQYHLWHPIRKVGGPLPEIFARHAREKIVKTDCGLDLIPKVVVVEL